MQLSSWNPFKFTRKAKKDGDKPKEMEKKAAKAEPAALAPAPQDWLRSFFGMPSFAEAWLRGDLMAPFQTTENWFGDFSPTMFRPSIDIVDDGKMLKVSIELPGMSEKDVKITIEDGALVISGEKRLESKTDTADCYRVERAYGAFRRVLPLPSDVDQQHIDAKMEKGVLTLGIPKVAAAEAKPTTIPIKTA
jgi:HSP20 family protein